MAAPWPMPDQDGDDLASQLCHVIRLIISRSGVVAQARPWPLCGSDGPSNGPPTQTPQRLVPQRLQDGLTQRTEAVLPASRRRQFVALPPWAAMPYKSSNAAFVAPMARRIPTRCPPNSVFDIMPMGAGLSPPSSSTASANSFLISPRQRPPIATRHPFALAASQRDAARCHGGL